MHLRNVANTLTGGKPLAKKYKNYSLSGNYTGFKECHIEPDWLLIYRIKQNELELFLFRTGSHADWF